MNDPKCRHWPHEEFESQVLRRELLIGHQEQAEANLKTKFHKLEVGQRFLVKSISPLEEVKALRLHLKIQPTCIYGGLERMRNGNAVIVRTGELINIEPHEEVQCYDPNNQKT